MLLKHYATTNKTRTCKLASIWAELGFVISFEQSTPFGATKITTPVNIFENHFQVSYKQIFCKHKFACQIWVNWTFKQSGCRISPLEEWSFGTRSLQPKTIGSSSVSALVTPYWPAPPPPHAPTQGNSTSQVRNILRHQPTPTDPVDRTIFRYKIDWHHYLHVNNQTW